MNEATRRAQEAMDAQGFVILKTERKLKRGRVLKGPLSGGQGIWEGDCVPGPFLVIGEATPQEWQTQQERAGTWIPSFDPQGWNFYKLVAE